MFSHCLYSLQCGIFVFGQKLIFEKISPETGTFQGMFDTIVNFTLYIDVFKDYGFKLPHWMLIKLVQCSFVTSVWREKHLVSWGELNKHSFKSFIFHLHRWYFGLSAFYPKIDISSSNLDSRIGFDRTEISPWETILYEQVMRRCF